MEHPLRIWRERNGKRLGDLAKAAGVRSSHLSMIERGIRGVSLDVASKLSKATSGEVPVDAFVRPDHTGATA
jgi:transcriptional regulator with XRE-family HTH domain